MTKDGDLLEITIFERVNRIIKEEYLNDYCIKNITQV